MRVLVTGATGALGHAVVERLAGAGASVRALARHTPASPAPGVEFLAGDIRDPSAVAAAVRGVDVVAHLAWVVTSGVSEAEMRAINLDGTANVLAALGSRRLVFSSSVTAYGSFGDHPQPYHEDEPLRPDSGFIYGSHKKMAEEMIAGAGVDAVVARVGPVMGRGVDNTVSRIFGGPTLLAVKGDDTRWQFVHDEDVGRFFASACLGSRTGVVNLAADDALTLDEVGAVMGKPVTRLSIHNFERMLRLTMRLGIGEMDPEGFSGVRYIPAADTSRLRDEWGFRCAWTSAETMADLARSINRAWYLGPFSLPKPWRMPWDGEPGVLARRFLSFEVRAFEKDCTRLPTDPAVRASLSNDLDRLGSRLHRAARSDRLRERIDQALRRVNAP